MSDRRLAVIAFDACDAGTVRALAGEGRLPAFAGLLERARASTVKTPYAFFVGAVWPSFATGRQAPEHGFTCWNEIDPATYEDVLTRPRDMRGEPFWWPIAASGRQVAVLDVPHVPVRPFDGVHVGEWGCHDRHEGLRSWPEAVAGEIVERFGYHPVLGADPLAVRKFAPDDWAFRSGTLRNAAEDEALLAALIDGMERKNRVSLDLLGREEWDLFVTVFGETHAGGHHLWHHHDRRHPRHDPRQRLAAPGDDAIVRLYRAADAALAEHLEAVGDAAVLVLLSHGMGPHFDGTHLLEEVLRRIDGFDTGGPRGGRPARLAKRAWASVPAPVRRRAMALPAAGARWHARRHGLTTSWHEMEPAERASRAYYQSPNNTVVGGVRFNLIGREAQGRVEPRDLAAMAERLRADLLDVVDVDTGRPLVEAVVRTEDVYERHQGDRLPDLLVEWNRGNPIETVWSPKVGLLHGPYGLWRTGDHRTDGLALAAGPGIAPGPVPAIDTADLGPTVCAWFGVDLPGSDGRPVGLLDP